MTTLAGLYGNPKLNELVNKIRFLLLVFLFLSFIDFSESGSSIVQYIACIVLT